MDVSELAADAAGLLAEYGAAIGSGVANKASADVAAKVYELVKQKVSGRKQDSRALDSLVQEPESRQHRDIIAAIVDDIASDDTHFADQLRQLVGQAKSLGGDHVVVNAGPGASLDRAIVNNRGVIDQSTHTSINDRRRWTYRTGVSAPVLIVVSAFFLVALLIVAIVVLNGADDRDRAGSDPSWSSSDRSEAVRPPHVIGGGKAETSLIYETNPRKAVLKLYEDIAQGDVVACARFTEEARAQFADHFADLGANCEEVVGALSKQVTPGQKSEYVSSAFSLSVEVKPTSDTVPVSSCALEVTGGPRLGLLTVGKADNVVGDQWIVVRHDAEPADC